MNLTGNYDDMLTQVVGEHIELSKKHKHLRHEMEDVRDLAHRIDSVGFIGAGDAISDCGTSERNNIQLHVGASKGDIAPILELMEMENVEGALEYNKNNGIFEAELVVNTGL